MNLRESNIRFKKAYAELVSQFTIIETICSGSFGTVEKVKRKTSRSDVYALKTLDRKMLDEQELEILMICDHPNIIKLIATFGHGENLCERLFVMEYCGSHIGDYIEQKPKRFSYDDKQSFCQQILQGVNYLHSNRILHRDIKPQNILLKNGSSIKIIDFGLSKILESVDETITTTPFGTLAYMAPEMLDPNRNTYGLQFDMWSVGCTFLEMYTHDFLPIEFDYLSQWNHLVNSYGYETGSWCRKSDEWINNKIKCIKMRDLINRILVLDPAERLTAAQALQHDVFRPKSFICKFFKRFSHD